MTIRHGSDHTKRFLDGLRRAELVREEDEA
jgi:hypothetical protein